LEQNSNGLRRHEGAVIFVVVILGTAGIVLGWQQHSAFLASRSAAAYLCTQKVGQCSPFYSLNGNFYIKGDFNQTYRSIPESCGPVQCRIYSSNLTVSHPEWLFMAYRPSKTIYAELDALAPTGQWVEVMHSPGDGYIGAPVPCNFGIYRYWFSSETNQTSYVLTVDTQVQGMNYTGTCG
jgi:hypothetical protein